MGEIKEGYISIKRDDYKYFQDKNIWQVAKFLGYTTNRKFVYDFSTTFILAALLFYGLGSVLDQQCLYTRADFTNSNLTLCEAIIEADEKRFTEINISLPSPSDLLSS